MDHDIEPERLTVYAEHVEPSMEGHIDPATYPEGNHPTCIRLLRAAGLI